MNKIELTDELLGLLENDVRLHGRNAPHDADCILALIAEIRHLRAGGWHKVIDNASLPSEDERI